MAAKRWLLICFFFASGATALVYEVVWSKYLTRMFGSTVQAQTVVLAAFMGGLALGNSLFGRKSGRWSAPIRAYGIIEVAIGLYAFFFNSIFEFTNTIFIAVGSSALHSAFLLLTLKALLSAALLLGPTVLMGGTLPVLATWLRNNFPDAGRRSAMFYGVNSLGAVAGATLAGFFLVQELGMVATLQATALLNVLIGVLAFFIGKPSSVSSVSPPPNTTPEVVPAPEHRYAPAAWIVAFTGAISMSLEVFSARSLSLIFGSSLQAFAIVLIAFILGIGLGSVWISRRRADPAASQRWIIILVLAAAIWIGLLVLNIESWVTFYRWASTGVARTAVGYLFHHFLTALIAIAVLGIPAALLGSVLPLQIRVHGQSASELGREVGRLLTANTCGAVVGVLVAGFVLMPFAGLRNSFGFTTLVLCAAAGLFAWNIGLRKHAASAAVVAIAFTVGFSATGAGWRHVISSGAFRMREQELNSSKMALRKEHIRILFYEDAADATVSVEHGDGSVFSSQRSLRINGKADASSHSDLCTQLLIGHLPLLARPNSKDVFVLGLGSGITAGAVAAHPVERLTIAENCQPVIRAARYFDEWNRGVLTNPVARVWREDARTILQLSRQQYDVIILEPSNPWTVGVGSVFSSEFYHLASSRLKPGGLVAQWFHMYEMSDEIVALVLRTFNSVFPFVEIWETGGGDLILLGARQSWTSTPEAFEQAFNREQARKDFATVGIPSAQALFMRQLASQRTAFAIAGDGPIQSDLFPILEYAAPKAFFLGKTCTFLLPFDERTVQAAIAPSEKRAALDNLPDAQLQPVFADYKSINPQVLQQVRTRLQADPGKAAAATNAPAADLDPEIRDLLSASALLDQDSAACHEGIERIANLLANRGPKADWSPSHYGGLAAKAALRLGATAKSRRVIDLALRLEPASAELQYLDRVLRREESLRNSALSSAR